MFLEVSRVSRGRSGEGRGGGRGEGVWAPVLQSLFNKAAGLKVCGFAERRLQYVCFSCVTCEIFESTFFDEPLATIASDFLNFDILLG